LLDRYGIKTPTTSFYEYNKLTKSDYLLRVLKEGKSVALISDAGTPGISDPGHSIIRLALEHGIPLVAIPGPSALVMALVISGKPTHKFTFEGFLSPKSSARKRRLQTLRDEGRTAILYESPHRLVKLLSDILTVYGDVEIALARELTKKFEDVRRGKASDLLAQFQLTRPRGEFIVVI
jgi:16S rRNA (cytidine1402-2'-O)-methyltransferase